MINKLQFGGWVGGFDSELPWKQQSYNITDYNALTSEALNSQKYVDKNGYFDKQTFNLIYGQSQYTKPLKRVEYTNEELAFLNEGTNAPIGGWDSAVWDMEEEDMSYVNDVDRQGLSEEQLLASGVPTKKQERLSNREKRRYARVNRLLNKYGNRDAVNAASILFTVGMAADKLGWEMQDRADATEIDQMINNIPGLGLVNSAFGKKTIEFGINKDVQSQIGGSYRGTSDLFNKASNNERVGLAGRISGAVRRLNKAKRKAQQQQVTMEGIAKEAEDLAFVATSDLNSQAYNTLTMGGFDPRVIRNAKGGKLESRINFIKTKQLNKVINTITLEIEDIEVDTWEPVITFKTGGRILELVSDWEPVIVLHQEGGKVEWTFDTWFNSIPESNRDNKYDYKKAFETHTRELLEAHAKDPENSHLYSVSNKADENGYYPFLKLGRIEDNPEILGEFDWYNSEEGKEHRSKFDIKYIRDRYYYVPKKELTFEDWLNTAPEGMKKKFLEKFEIKDVNGKIGYVPKEMKRGGSLGESETSEIEETSQKNVIPEGALHKNKHHIEHTEGLTQKGIPVVDNEGNLQAEVEVNELILTLEVTKAIEELYEKYYDEDSKQSEKDLAAIEAGKILVELILINTDDRTGLIDSIEV